MTRARVFVAVISLVALASTVSCTAQALLPPATPGNPTPAPAPVDAGTPGWQLSKPGPDRAIEGFTDRTSVMPGQAVRLFVSTSAAGFTVTAFRIGNYQRSDAQAVWTSPRQTGEVQAAAVVQKPTSTVVAPWHPSLTLDTRQWLPGDYLLRLDGDDGNQRFVPLTVRTPSNAGRVVVINAVTTWQAYNHWGGYSLYKGPDAKRPSRSRGGELRPPV